MFPSSHPAHRTGRACFKHQALGERFTMSPTGKCSSAWQALPGFIGTATEVEEARQGATSLLLRFRNRSYLHNINWRTKSCRTRLRGESVGAAMVDLYGHETGNG